jgi:hypothetical protein
MPDWSYLTLVAPALRHLPPRRARDLLLGAYGRLARAPGGSWLIQLMADARPPSAASIELLGVCLPGRVGISGEVDPWLLATAGLAGLGLGLMEVGPVTILPSNQTDDTYLDGSNVLSQSDRPVGPGLEQTRRRLSADRVCVPLLARVSATPASSLEEATAQLAQLLRGLEPFAAVFALETRWALERWSAPDLEQCLRHCRRVTARPLLLTVAPDCANLESMVAAAQHANFDGFQVGGGLRSDGDRRVFGPCTRQQVEATVHQVRALVGPATPLLAEGGIDEPADALDLRAAGADVVLLHSGLVVSGPGLPKRINEALCVPAREPSKATAWLPLLLLGIGMLVGGALAWAVAATRVVLPYDEAFLGLDRVSLALINARLLAFMAHDRVTLAGTMLSIGVLYAGLAGWGVRDGARWAWRAVVWSAAVGFASFFLFLGFGYFDPLHAAVSVPLLVLFLLGLRNAPSPGSVGSAYPSLWNDRRWRLAQWGQLTFVSVSLALIAAGAAIASIGVSGVLVAEDVHFLGVPAEALRAANVRLLPLVAHDRAGFGGALASDGICVLLTSLWGFRRGARWVWWMLLLSGVLGFGAALGVHLAVGYLEPIHVAPAILGATFFCLGLALSHPYLCAVTNARPGGNSGKLR